MFQNFKFKLFIKLFSVYICVFLIPFIIFGSIVSQYTMGNYKQEVLDNNISITDYVCQLVDDNLDDVIIANLQIMENDVVSNFVNNTDISPGEMAYRSKKVAEEIQKYRTYKNAIREIDIYIATHDCIITETTYCTREEYYQSYLSGSEYTFEEWNRILDGEFEESFLLIPSYDNVSDRHTATLMKPLMKKDGKVFVQSLIVIDMDYIIDTYERMFSGKYTPYLSIVYGDQVLTKGSATHKDFDVSKLTTSDGMVQEFDDGYIAVVRESSSLGLRYVSVLREDEVLATVKKTNMILIVILMCIIMLLAVGAVMFSNKTFQPFKWFIGINSAEGGNTFDSFAEVQNFLLNTINSNKSLSEVVSKQEKCINDNFYKLFIQNSMALDKNLLNTIFSDTSISVKDKWFRAAIVNVNDTGSHTEESAEISVISYFSEALKESHIGFYVLPNESSKIILVLSYNGSDRINYLFEKMARQVLEIGQIDITMCIGRAVESLYKFTKSYEDAFFEMQNAPSGVICSEGKHHFSYDEYFSFIKKDKLTFDVNSGNVEGVKKFFEDLKHIVFVENVSSYGVQNYVRYLIESAFEDVLKMAQLSNEQSRDFAEQGRCALEKQSITESFSLFEELFVKIAEIIAVGIANTSGEKIIAEIIRYVDDNYSMPDLSLKMITEELDVTSYKYISEIFKDKTGVKFTDYLHNVRINEAKRLLLYTDMMIFEIAEKVGYLSSNVFIRSFKKTVGITPGDFRKTKG